MKSVVDRPSRNGMPVASSPNLITASKCGHGAATAIIRWGKVNYSTSLDGASSLFGRDEMMRGNSCGGGGERVGVSENAVGVPPLTWEKHI